MSTSHRLAVALEEVLDEAGRGLPLDFRERMGPEPGEDAGPEGLLDARVLEARLLETGLRRIDEALNREASDREGAFSLLAADALLTLACERAALEDDGDELLHRTMRGISERLT